MWIYDDGGYSNVHFGKIDIFECCFITDILKKNKGRVSFKVFGNSKNYTLYDCSDDEYLIE